MDFFLNLLSEVINNVEKNFWSTIFYYFIFLFIYSIFSLPGLIIFVAIAGYLFGIYFSFIIGIISITIGSFIFFVLSQFFLQKLFPSIYTKYTNKINHYISKSTLEYLVIFRIIPSSPLMLQNIILSLLKIPYLTFIIASFLGFSPIIFVSVFIGNKMKDIKSITKLSTSDFYLMILYYLLF